MPIVSNPMRISFFVLPNIHFFAYSKYYSCYVKNTRRALCKIMRRVLRARERGEEIGDTSTPENG